MKPTLPSPLTAARQGNRGPALVLVGTDFRLAPLELREKVAFSAEEAAETLEALRGEAAVAEAFLLSTCNRTEVYVHPRDEQGALSAVVQEVFEARAPNIQTQGRLAVHWHDEAAAHLLAVASGLESMVLGEPEILGQVKQAAALAETSQAAGPVLQRLLRAALVSGKRVRRETEIASGAVSFGYAAVELARNIFSRLDRTRVLLVGAGDIARQVARSLLERGSSSLTICNRSRSRAEALRQDLGTGEIADFEDRGVALGDADLVVVSTSAEEPVLGLREVRGAMVRRRSQPLLMVDLGVPRNVDPAVADLNNVFLHDIDSLKHLVDRNLRLRREEAPRARGILEEELEKFFDWFGGQEAEPIVAQLQRHAEEVRAREVEAFLDRLPPESHEHVEQLTRVLVRKLLHHPSQRLRRQARSPEELGFVRDLFQLEDPPADGDDG